MAVVTVNRPIVESSAVNELIDQFKRLNDNFERYLEHINAKVLPSAEELAVADPRTFFAEPLSELEMAVKEHKKLQEEG